MAALLLLLNKVSPIVITALSNFLNSFMLRLMGRFIDSLCDSERLSLFHMDGVKQLFFSSCFMFCSSPEFIVVARGNSVCW